MAQFIDSRQLRKLICYPVNHTVAIVPARLASTRLPGKALIEIAGKPMVCWVAERARAARNVDRVIVATDSQQIVDAVESLDIEAVLTAPITRAAPIALLKLRLQFRMQRSSLTYRATNR